MSVNHDPRAWLREYLRYARFRARYARVLKPALPESGERGNAIVVSGPNTSVSIDLLLARGLTMAGYAPVALLLEPRHHARYYRLAGIARVVTWEDFMPAQGSEEEAMEAVAGFRNRDDVLAFTHANADVGLIAISMLFRRLRIGSLDLDSAEIRNVLAEELARSMANAVAAANIVRKLSPRLAVFSDVVYGRRAELFANCLESGATVVRWRSTHRNNALLLTRYTAANRKEHPETISPESWERVSKMQFTDGMRRELEEELRATYAAGTWYGESGTQFGTRLLSADDVRSRLGLDPARRTAMICSHILWDAPLCWEDGLFPDYESWLVETVRAAATNDRVNWLLKIHPANAGKQRKEGYPGEPAELPAIRKHLGDLPPGIVLIPADSEISTFSILDAIDYCLTVRGTIGIEAAVRGIPVLTAGNGRYARRGFTIDSRSTEDYLERVRSIDAIGPLTDHQRGLAERFAYAFFMLRPWQLRSATYEFAPGRSSGQNFDSATLTLGSADAWSSAPDLRELVSWLNDSTGVDFLTSPRTG